MAELKIYISEGLNEKFRRIAMRVHGYGRGSLSKAAEEALTKWCSEREPPQFSEKTLGNLGNPRDQPSKEAKSHVNPDERENANQETSRIGEDKILKPTGLST